MTRRLPLTFLLVLTSVGCSRESDRQSPGAQVEPRDLELPTITAPTGFTSMEYGELDRLSESSTDSGVRSGAGWVSTRGAREGFVVAERHVGGGIQEYYGATVSGVVAHVLSQRLGPDDAALAITTAESSSVLVEYERQRRPLPVSVRGRFWFTHDGALSESTCSCTGTGCTQPAACILPQAPSVNTVAGAMPSVLPGGFSSSPDRS